MASIDKFKDYEKRKNILEKIRTFLLASHILGLVIIPVLAFFVSLALSIYYIPFFFFLVLLVYFVIPSIDGLFQKKYFGRSFWDEVVFNLNHDNTFKLLDVLNIIGDNKLIWVIGYININDSNETSNAVKDEYIKSISHEVLNTNMSWHEMKRFAENLPVETGYFIHALTEEYNALINTLLLEKKKDLPYELFYEIFHEINLFNIDGEFSLSCFDSDLINKISTTLGTGEKVKQSK